MLIINLKVFKKLEKKKSLIIIIFIFNQVFYSLKYD